MNLGLQDIRRSSDDDRYVWAPFELNDQFNGDWWDSPRPAAVYPTVLRSSCGQMIKA